MNSLFSHAQEPPGSDDHQALQILDPVVNTVVVPGAVAHAFTGFTDHTHLWWPLESHGVYGADSYVEFEENLILETADDGRTTIWGTLDDWQPPLSFHATWHPGTTALWSTELLVVFRSVEEGTEVRVFHEGWEGAEDPAATRAKYATAWPEILGRYARFMGAAGTPDS
ncbi:hypothetical protein Asphe3_07810 [Pseudarthrobacter phenanthrenivorans Sphe3]|uniref:Activator of Hsp90 ATPase homolog 1-like protein n=1 Tax=Pseudarthrobacter phenanthrenivorans (strain DSM 18606 / JCM 16027 / LMG 23796 / Sphe3) TaxID=930171 RepID=F0M1N5_PSEPM|nr:hypothetical protein [Pseudarthrobacter phenanthrenivorans]ADX71981.1 hypothetical protein Asphe3_07810 [Pseudarthrobacter phenanthrenivorans Sphe3]